MRLRFGPDDIDAFEVTRDRLLADLGRSWPGGDDAAMYAQLALDWKWTHGGGDLGSWRLDDLNELLVEWCPRAVALPPSEAGHLVGSVSTLLAFLADRGLLGPGSAPLFALQSRLASMESNVTAAMADSSAFGMGKSIFAAMGQLDTLIDGPDPESLQTIMDSFNDLPREERDRILGLAGDPPGPWEQLSAGVPLGPAPMVAREEANRLAASTGFLARTAIVRDFVGSGRRLTAKGNLTVADAKDLAGLLDDRSLAMHTRYGTAIRSADDLPTMQFLLRWARRAGALRVANGKLQATASWAKMDALAAATRAASVLVDHGPLALEAAEHAWVPHALIGVLDEGVRHLLALLWAVPEPLDFEELLDAVAAVCELQLRYPPHITPEMRHNQVRRELDTLFEVLALAGVADRQDATQQKVHTLERIHGGSLCLTTLGRCVLGPYLSAHGYPIPEAGGLAERPLAEIFAHIDDWPADRTRIEFDHWVDRHSPDDAIDQMAALMDDYSDPQWPVAALDLVERLGAPADERAVRRFVDTAARGHALSWLAGRGHADVPDDPPAMLTAGLELLSMHALQDRDEELLEVISRIDHLDIFIADAAEIATPAAVTVLEGIGRVHPDPDLARAARKAAMRLASRS